MNSAPRRIVRFTVPGKPEPKGSTRIVPVRGRDVVTSDNPKLAAWQRAIAWQARAACASLPLLFPGPVLVRLVFRLAPPARRVPGRTLPVVRPDVDKLARAVLDALTGAVLGDDAQVVDLGARKVYAAAPDVPGVDVWLADAEPGV